MDIKYGFVDFIGYIFLICFNSFSDEIGCEILGKVEFMNFGGFVKDWVVLGIIEIVEKEGKFKFGGIVVEGIVGNMGIGFVYICNVKGYKCLIVIFDI